MRCKLIVGAVGTLCVAGVIIVGLTGVIAGAHNEDERRQVKADSQQMQEIQQIQPAAHLLKEDSLLVQLYRMKGVGAAGMMQMQMNRMSALRMEMSSKQSEEVAELEADEDLESLIEKDDEKEVYDLITGNDESVERDYLPDESYFNRAAVNEQSAMLSLNCVYQMPELPTGCEITSLTTVLNYLGYSVSKETMADVYLPKCSLQEGSFWHYFVGNPRSEYSYGCFAAPIVEAAQEFLTDQGSLYQAANYSGSDFSVLLNEVAAGNPVILWSTIGLKPAYQTQSWKINGEVVRWTAPEHCVVLAGYDLAEGTALISDPLVGMVMRDLDTVVCRYNQMSSQAVVITGGEQRTEDSAPSSEVEKNENQSEQENAGQGAENSGETVDDRQEKATRTESGESGQTKPEKEQSKEEQSAENGSTHADSTDSTR